MNNVEKEFYSNVSLPNENGCMNWMGRIYHPKPHDLEDSNDIFNEYGGYLWTEENYEVTTSAHAYSYELFYGKIPDTYYVEHKCNNPYCVAPEHLCLFGLDRYVLVSNNSNARWHNE